MFLEASHILLAVSQTGKASAVTVFLHMILSVLLIYPSSLILHFFNCVVLFFFFLGEGKNGRGQACMNRIMLRSHECLVQWHYYFPTSLLDILGCISSLNAGRSLFSMLSYILPYGMPHF